MSSNHSPPSSPAAVAGRFIEAFAAGDKGTILALCAPDAVAEYVPWGSDGRNSVSRAVEVWARYPAAFDGFAMPIVARYEDADRATAIVATLNSGTQRSDVDGIRNVGGTMACPHLFVNSLDDTGLIRHVQVWCDQVTLYRQLGFPAGFAEEDS